MTWKRFRSKRYDELGILHWDADGGNSKVSVSKYYPDAEVNVSDGYDVQITSVKEAKAGYPHSKVGISKEEALSIAKRYMKANPNG